MRCLFSGSLNGVRIQIGTVTVEVVARTVTVEEGPMNLQKVSRGRGGMAIQHKIIAGMGMVMTLGIIKTHVKTNSNIQCLLKPRTLPNSLVCPTYTPYIRLAGVYLFNHIKAFAKSLYATNG